MGLESSKSHRLSKDEINSVTSVWSIVMKNPEKNGNLILKTFLDKHNYYSMFDKFKGVPAEEITDSKVFRRHGTSIVLAINGVIANLDDESAINEELIRIGKLHKRRMVTEQQFKELEIVILDLLAQHFRISPSDRTAWEKTFNIAHHYIFKGLASH